jgi:hypothetical protein
MMTKILTFIALLLLSLTFASAASAATYYIAPDACDPYHTNCNPNAGKDTNPGTVSQPIKTFTKAYDLLHPGDTLILLDGVYHQHFRPNKRAGTAENPITIRAQYDGLATIDGRFQHSAISFDWTFPGADAYYVFEGMNTRNGDDLVIRINKAHVTLRRIHSYITLEDWDVMTVREAKHPIHVGGGGDNVLIEDCVFSGYGSKMLKTIRAPHAVIRRCVTDWRWNNAHTDHNSWPWNGGLNVYHTSETIYENIVALGNIAIDYAINFHGVERSDHPNPVNNNRYLGSMGIYTGYTLAGQLYEWPPIRSQPNTHNRTDNIIDVNWGGRRTGFALGGGMRDTLFQDIISYGNAGVGLNISGYLTDYSYNNRIVRATIAGNGAHAVSADGGPNTDMNCRHTQHESFTISDSYIKNINDPWSGPCPSFTGQGADITKRYVDGVKTNEPLWPWPMEERIRQELGYSVTNIVAKMTQEMHSKGYLSYVIPSIPDIDRPKIAVSQTYLPFPKTTLGSTSTELFTISNPGDASLVVKDITITNDLASNIFTRVSGGTCSPTFPFTIPAKGSCTISLRFAPQALTFYTGRIKIHPGNMGRVAHPFIVSILGIGHPQNNTVNIPGRVRAEYYTNAYDTSPGNVKNIPTFSHGVDVRPTRDQDAYEFKIGFITPGEWTEYPIQISQSGTYTLVARSASNSTKNKQFKVLLNDQVLTTINPPFTGGWETFEDTIVHNINLPSGSHTLRLAFDTGDFELNYIDLMSSDTSPTPNLKPGDANGDGKVDGLDYVIWLNNYGTTTTDGASKGDFNNDGKVDGLDYVIWLNNYGT